jgi:ssDNA-binding Zn-finger/Zn-ribbon topoisomerase 1
MASHSGHDLFMPELTPCSDDSDVEYNLPNATIKPDSSKKRVESHNPKQQTEVDSLADPSDSSSSDSQDEETDNSRPSDTVEMASKDCTHCGRTFKTRRNAHRHWVEACPQNPNRTGSIHKKAKSDRPDAQEPQRKKLKKKTRSRKMSDVEPSSSEPENKKKSFTRPIKPVKTKKHKVLSEPIVLSDDQALPQPSTSKAAAHCRKVVAAPNEKQLKLISMPIIDLGPENGTETASNALQPIKPEMATSATSQLKSKLQNIINAGPQPLEPTVRKQGRQGPPITPTAKNTSVAAPLTSVTQSSTCPNAPKSDDIDIADRIVNIVRSCTQQSTEEIICRVTTELPHMDINTTRLIVRCTLASQIACSREIQEAGKRISEPIAFRKEMSRICYNLTNYLPF